MQNQAVMESLSLRIQMMKHLGVDLFNSSESLNLFLLKILHYHCSHVKLILLIPFYSGLLLDVESPIVVHWIMDWTDYTCDNRSLPFPQCKNLQNVLLHLEIEGHLCLVVVFLPYDLHYIYMSLIGIYSLPTHQCLIPINLC